MKKVDRWLLSKNNFFFAKYLLRLKSTGTYLFLFVLILIHFLSFYNIIQENIFVFRIFYFFVQEERNSHNILSKKVCLDSLANINMFENVFEIKIDLNRKHF